MPSIDESVLNAIINGVIVREGNGAYTNNPKDKGGPTRWGVTEATARAYGYTGGMETLPRDMAVEIYKRRYWFDVKFDKIAEINSSIANRLVDFGVLAGQATSAKMLQRALNVLNQNAKQFPDLTTDGNVGNMTLQALKSFIDIRCNTGSKVLVRMIVSQQSVYLIERAELNSNNEEFEYGWQLNRILENF